MNVRGIVKQLFLVPVFLIVAPGVLAQAPDLDKMDLVLKSVPDGPVANVDGVSLGREEFVSFYESELMRATQFNNGKALPEGARVRLALWCIGRQIEDEVLYQEARRRKLTVPMDSVERTWNDRAERLRKGMAEQRGEEVSEAEVLATLGFERREDVLTDIERFLLINKCRKAIVMESGLTIDEDEVNELYGENRERFVRPDMMHLRQVYIRVPPVAASEAGRAHAEARNRAEDALARIQSGQSFEGVARTVSEGPGKESGGDLGLLPVDQLPPFLVDAALSLAPGEISPVIESEFGFHLVKLVDVKAGAEVSLGEASPLIRRRLVSDRALQTVRDYCDVLLREDVVVEVYLELEKTLSTDPALAELKLR